MTDRPGFCENRDGLICDGVNGLKSIVQGFGGNDGRTSAPPAPTPTPPEPEITSTPEEASEATPPPPPPPPPPPVIVTSTPPPEVVTVSVTPPANTPTPVAAIPPPPPPEMASPLLPQEPTTNQIPPLILPTPVVLTSTSSRGSFIASLPTRTAIPTGTPNPVNNPLVPSIFASSDFNTPIVGQATTLTSSPAVTVIVTPAPAQGAISDRSTQFPAALVAGVSGGVIAFIFVFALLWRWYLRKQSQRRHANSLADEKGLVRTHDHDGHHGPFDRPADRIVTTEIWTGSKQPSKSDQTRFSWAATEVSLGADLEPLSPKPVIQQTVHRVSVPAPVEASSFRSGSKEGSLRGSVSRPPSALQQATTREAAATQGTESKLHRSSSRLQVPGAYPVSQPNDLPTQDEESEGGDPVPDLSDFDLVPAPLESKKEEQVEGPGLQRQYTLRSSPLHQNPFRDPVVEEDAPSEASTETPMSVTFEIVNTDTPSPPRSSTTGSEQHEARQNDERQENNGSPIHVLQTITLTAEDLKRASTAKTIVG